MIRTMWCPGRFRLTNGMLSDLRAAGRYSAGRFGRAPIRGPWDRFAEETRAIRLLVKATAARERWPLCPYGYRAVIRCEVFGHQRHDPDAWLLLGKAAVDGLVDAHVLSSDRRSVGVLAGYVEQSGEATCRPEGAARGPGFALTVSWPGGD